MKEYLGIVKVPFEGLTLQIPNNNLHLNEKAKYLQVKRFTCVFKIYICIYIFIVRASLRQNYEVGV